MIELGLANYTSDSPAPEVRNNYTSIILDAILAGAAGNSSGSSGATAALEMAASRWARALATARASDPAITPALLADIGRALCTRGEVVYDLVVDPVRGLQFIPACDWSVFGDANRATWWYRLTMAGPSSTYTVERPAQGVAHFLYSFDARQPWRGIGPLGWASATGSLAGHVEGALRDEASGPRGSIVPLPENTKAQDGLKAGFAALRGGLALPETTSGGHGDRAQSPQRDWRVERLGANPPSALVALRQAVEVSVLSACGVPGSMAIGLNDGVAMRESYRQFLHLLVRPLGKLVAATFSEVLGQPVTLQFDDLGAADIQSRARAWRQLAGREASMAEAEASRIVGFTE